MSKPGLIDTRNRPLRDLRISITDKCNYRCPYCMPAEIFGASYQFLDNGQVLNFDEIERLARLFISQGVTKLRLTGGEPLLRPGVEELLARLARLPGVEDLALTTNGFFLADKAQRLKEAGLSRLTVSLDSLDNDVYQAMNGRRGTVERVLAGIEQARAAGFSPIKINCVVKRGVNDHTLVPLARYCRDQELVLRFIEYMDVGNLNGWRMEDVVTGAEILDRIKREMPLKPVEPNYFGEVARRYQYVDGSGEIGLVASVTQPFCGSCTRARLSCAGEYYTCLFGTRSVDLRTPLRQGASDEALLALIAGTWRQRTDRYSQLRASFTRLPRKGAEMYRLGG